MKRHNNQKGIALPIVLLFIIVLILLGFALSTYGYYESVSAIREEHLTKAYYVARASISALAQYLTKEPANDTEMYAIADYVDKITSSGNYASGEINGIQYRITATRVNDFGALQGVLTLTSLGKSGNFEKKAALQIGYSLKEYTNMGPFGVVDSALYAENTAESGGSLGDYKAKAYGKVKTNNPNTSKIKVTVIGQSSPYNVPVYEPQPHPLPSNPVFPSITKSSSTFTSDPDLIPDESFYYNGTIKVKPAATYDGYNDRTYDATNKLITKGTPTYIKVTSLNIAEPFYFNNNGPIYLMVENSLEIAKNVGCSPNCGYIGGVYTHAPECWLGRVNIFFTGTNPIRITGNPYIRANIVALNAAIIQPDKDPDFYIGGNVTMSGHVISGGDRIELYGSFENAPSMIYAPKASVFLGGSAFTHNGAIICDTFEANANANLYYQAITRASLPYWFDDDDSFGTLGDSFEIGTGEFYAKNLIFTRWTD